MIICLLCLLSLIKIDPCKAIRRKFSKIQQILCIWMTCQIVVNAAITINRDENVQTKTFKNVTEYMEIFITCSIRYFLYIKT